jgi:hypothetical protein
VVDAAICVHRSLGPGLLESAYQSCLAYELIERGLHVACEVALPIVYAGQTLDAGYRPDMLVEEQVIIENKVVETNPAAPRSAGPNLSQAARCLARFPVELERHPDEKRYSPLRLGSKAPARLRDEAHWQLPLIFLSSSFFFSLLPLFPLRNFVYFVVKSLFLLLSSSCSTLDVSNTCATIDLLSYCLILEE